MTNENNKLLTENRLHKLEGTPKNIKCPGVVRKLRRQVRQMSK